MITKSLMIPKPTQLPNIVRFYGTQYWSDVKKYMEFGYTNYEVMLVGGAGGRAGLSTGQVVYYTDRGQFRYSGLWQCWLWGASGGGGGTSYTNGKLKDLPTDVLVEVGGAAGNAGTVGINQGRSNAGNGGQSAFNGLVAGGGGGGVGAECYSAYAGGAAAPGYWNDGYAGGGGGGNYSGGGAGGRGCSAVKRTGYYNSTSFTQGAGGAASGSWGTPGQGPVYSGYSNDLGSHYWGGGGGGCDIGSWLGLGAEYWGWANVAEAGQFSNGHVALKLS